MPKLAGSHSSIIMSGVAPPLRYNYDKNMDVGGLCNESYENWHKRTSRFVPIYLCCVSVNYFTHTNRNGTIFRF